MKFSRTALIERIDEIEADRRKAHDDAFAPRLKAWDDAVADYKKNRAPVLVAQLRGLADKARKGTVLTAEDITKTLGVTSYHRDNDTYRGFEYPSDPAGRGSLTKKPVPKPYEPDRALAALRNLLERTADEYVTTTGLKELGFQPQQFIKAAV